MYKDNIKGNPKVIMRKLKHQWQNITDDDLAEIEELYADYDYKRAHQKQQKEQYHFIKS